MVPGKRYRPVAPSTPFLLASDIDGTLLGDEEAQSALGELLQSHPQSIFLAVISGRSLRSVQTLVRDNCLPPPGFIGSHVGSELLDCRDPENRLGQKYAARVSPIWDLEEVYTLGEGEGIRRQAFEEGPPRFQAGFDWDGQSGAFLSFQSRLARLPHCRILPSSGRYIDVFPEFIGKGELVHFLQRELDVDPDRVVVAGDTGNDREMFELGFKGIVPANALEELKAAARGPMHYHSAWPFARGVLDGLCYFGLVE
jgi:hydroxymethylpyrimidine pyrophosphatase-like HAD family hydrolase